MRTALLMVAFSFGVVLLFPRQARSLDDCIVCPCKEMKAWIPVTPDPLQPLPTGLRKTDPDNPKLTVPVAHVPRPAHDLGFLLAAVPDPGKRTDQQTSYQLYTYSQPFIKDCNVKAGENGNSLVNVTFPDPTDWNMCTPLSPPNLVPWHRCEP